MSTARLILPVVAALAAAGCSTQWYPGFSHRDIARTDVVVRSEPTGASIDFDGARQQAPAPVRIPVEYTHVETHYDRQSNYGASMREGMSPVVTILTFPVWAVASLFHYREELLRHEYGGNIHVIKASLPGYDDASEEIKLEGEADHPVTFKLQKSK